MYARRYALYGALFGLLFPVLGSFFQALVGFADLSLAEGLMRSQAMPLMWIIDTAPVFLGLFARFGGHRQDELLLSEAAQREAFAQTSRELIDAAKLLSSSVGEMQRVPQAGIDSLGKIAAEAKVLSDLAALLQVNTES